jgi:hypothetical protein
MDTLRESHLTHILRKRYLELQEVVLTDSNVRGIKLRAHSRTSSDVVPLRIVMPCKADLPRGRHVDSQGSEMCDGCTKPIQEMFHSQVHHRNQVSRETVSSLLMYSRQKPNHVRLPRIRQVMMQPEALPGST